MRRIVGTLLAMLVLALPAQMASASTSSPSPQASGSPGSVTVPDQSSGVRPIVIVLDTSGSMGDRDSSGGTKLDGAKASLAQLIQRLPSRTDVGLWAYPGRASGANCDPGRIRVAVGPLDRTSTSLQIGALTAVGDTPTAEALTAVADDLTASGFHGATVLLVSDGESTCKDPCPVAQELRSKGFDITVQALGFQISSQGADQLRCIAGATGGTYHDVADSSQLLPTLIDAASPDIRLDVAAPSSLAPASTGTVSATVTNTTVNEAHDVVLTLSLAGSPGGAAAKYSDVAIPAVLNPVLRVGNVPAGASLTRTWAYSSGSPSPEPRTVRWQVIASGRDLVSTSRSGATVLSGAALTVDDAGAWLRDLVRGGGKAVILGDSYSSGEGTKNYPSESNRRDNRCHRSPDTYAMSLFPDGRKPVNLACSGAVIENLFAPKYDEEGEIAQLAHLDQLAFAPDLAFLTIGGNDIGFGDLISACADPRKLDNCDQQHVPNPFDAVPQEIPLAAKVSVLIRQTQARLVLAYKQVSRALNTPARVAQREGRIAQLIVLTYPAVLPLSGDRPCGSLEPSEIRFGSDVVRVLDEAIVDAAAQAREDGYPVHVVEGNEGAVQPNHTMCDKDHWINPINVVVAGVTGIGWGTREKEMVHPNVQGYAAFTQRIITDSQTDRLLPFTAPLPREGDAAPWLQNSDPTAVITADLAYQGTPTTYELESGATAVLHVAGGTAGAPVYVTTYSSPRTLGSFVLDTSGHLDVSVTIPPDLPVGQHHLVIDSVNAAGRPATTSVRLVVSEPLPALVRWLPAAAGLLVIVGCALVWVGLRRRRTSVRRP